MVFILQTAPAVPDTTSRLISLFGPLVQVLTLILFAVYARMSTTTMRNVHTLVNSQMGTQKRLTAIAARNLAVVAPTPENLLAARQAEQALADHVTQQGVVDREEGSS